MPVEWINKEQNGVTKEITDYIKPLIRGEIEVPYKDGIPDYLWQPGKMS